MRFVIGLAIVLAIFWFGLSWYLKPLLLGLGVFSILFTLFIVKRMGLFDDETVPYLYSATYIPYFGWLGGEIAKANVQVAQAVLDPELKISPKLVKIPYSHTTDLGRAIFANSITLTPGTVSVDTEEDHILVHALLAEMADPDGFKEMHDRSRKSIRETK